MKKNMCFMGVVVGFLAWGVSAAPKVLFQDDFERAEADDAKEQVGNDWGTNSATRAKGVKQADLVDGSLFIKRADVADHGVSVTHEVAFKDAEIRMRFKLDHEKDSLGINIADMKEKAVHAGHICMVKVGVKNVEITDLKTGRMNQETRKAREKGTLSAADAKALKSKTSYVKRATEPGKWHTLLVRISGETMSVEIDGEAAGSFTSPGIGHATKSRLRLAVGREAWVDDVKIVGE